MATSADRHEAKVSWRLLPLLAALLLGAAFGLHQVNDPDVFQQAAVGRTLVSRPGTFGSSPFHFTWPDYQYVNDKWLTSVIAAAFAATGDAGLPVYQLILCLGVALAWYAMLRAWKVGRWAALAGVALVLGGSGFRVEPRPETISAALLALLVALLGRERAFRRTLVLAGGLMVLWVNAHGYFVNGLLVLLAAAVASRLSSLPALVGPEDGRTPFRRGLILLGVGCLATLVHPQFYRAAIWPIKQLFVLGGDPTLRAAIQELFPSTELLQGMGTWRYLLLAGSIIVLTLAPLVHRFAAPPARLSLGALAVFPWLFFPPDGLTQWPYRLTLCTWLLAFTELVPHLRRQQWFQPLLFAGFSVLALPVARNLALLPPTAMLLWMPVFAEWSARSPGMSPRWRSAGVAAALLVVILIGGARLGDHLAPGIYRTPGLAGFGLDREALPVEAAEFIARENPPGELLNDFQSGGFLLARLYPTRRVFIAGNTSFYPTSFLADYRERVMAAGENLEAQLAAYGIRTVVLTHGALETPQLAGRLTRSPRWALVHVDRSAAVWVHREPATQPLIQRCQVRLPQVAAELLARQPRPRLLPGWLGPRCPVFPRLNLGIFYRSINHPELGLAEAAALWREQPREELATFSAAAAEEAGRLSEQVAWLEQARRLFPKSRPVQDWLARALFVRGGERLSQGQVGPAREDFLAALAQAPAAVGPLLGLARLEAEAGRIDAARDFLQRALRTPEGEQARRYASQDPLLAPLL